MIKILIVDDMRIVRECIKIIIEKNSDFKVVGCACNGIEAIEMCGKYKPDVILMDVIMPELNGIDAMVRIKEQDKKVKILILYITHKINYMRKQSLSITVSGIELTQ